MTEDADLGIRAAANGYTVGIINSTIYEEANKHLGNWIRQRSRWIKGYMQTWLVHNRDPLRLMRHVGVKALMQLIRKPFYWEKTNHGLTTVTTENLFAASDTSQQSTTP